MQVELGADFPVLWTATEDRGPILVETFPQYTVDKLESTGLLFLVHFSLFR